MVCSAVTQQRIFSVVASIISLGVKKYHAFPTLKKPVIDMSHAVQCISEFVNKVTKT